MDQLGDVFSQGKQIYKIFKQFDTNGDGQITEGLYLIKLKSTKIFYKN